MKFGRPVFRGEMSLGFRELVDLVTSVEEYKSCAQFKGDKGDESKLFACKQVPCSSRFRAGDSETSWSFDVSFNKNSQGEHGEKDPPW